MRSRGRSSSCRSPRGSAISKDELYSLNETGKDVWRLLDGRTLDEVVDALLAEYEAPREEIDRDVRGLLEELLSRGIVRAGLSASWTDPSSRAAPTR